MSSYEAKGSKFLKSVMVPRSRNVMSSFEDAGVSGGYGGNEG